ncbi:hypothetical protein Q4F19_06525 [Sphingomonas sp. BIUV-7]|uniref:Uncharacterized protein n=1 Tax=Sphingomonas natans TaxID=3063330 RepID=A0ABT8Y8L8_9SPHN|nr:hypothetical protein [Sphingomonas sp. BIUV-7]MDO6414030.1 hypothetical protein [Sphingomonas sp. BIUV-7]
MNMTHHFEGREQGDGSDAASAWNAKFEFDGHVAEADGAAENAQSQFAAASYVLDTFEKYLIGRGGELKTLTQSAEWHLVASLLRCGLDQCDVVRQKIDLIRETDFQPIVRR